MRVLVIGVAGRVGRVVAGWLAARGSVAAVTGLDERPCQPPVPGMRFLRARLSGREWLPLLDEADAVIHLPGAEWPLRNARDEGAVLATSKAALAAAAAAGVPRLIVAQSAALYGSQPDGPIPATAIPRGYRGGAYARTRALLADYLDLLSRAARQTVLTRLRVASLCDAAQPDLADWFASGPGFACGGELRRFQAAHSDNLCAAIEVALREDLPGIFHVGSYDGGATFRAAAELLGGRAACAPLGALMLRAWWRWRFHGARTPPGWVRALVRGGVLDDSELAGRVPAWGRRGTLDALRAARPR